MVICLNCGNKLHTRKLLFLTNHNSVTCQACSSKLQVKNKDVNSTIGGAIGGLGGGIGAVLVLSYLSTHSLIYFLFFIILIVVIFLTSLLLEDKYVKVKLIELSSPKVELAQN